MGVARRMVHVAVQTPKEGDGDGIVEQACHWGLV